MLTCIPVATEPCHLSPQSVRWLHVVLFTFTAIYHPTPRLYLLMWTMAGPSDMISLTPASVLKAVLLTITRLISLKHYFLDVITLLEILRWSDTEKKKTLGLTFHSHSFLPTLSSKAPSSDDL